MPNARIVSDGTPQGIKVFLEDGTQLKGMSAIHIDMWPRLSQARIELILMNPQIDVVVPATIKETHV